MKTPEIEKIAFESKEPDRGYTIRASYLIDNQDALIEIFKDGIEIRKFFYPAYRIYNLAAHFADMVDEFEEPQ